jgi:hypothetical protein
MMLIELIVKALMAIPRAVLGLIPDVTIPAYLTGTGPGTLAGTVSDLVASLAGINPWLPLAQLVAAAGLVLASMICAGVVKLVRIVSSYVTLGGGSAG